MEESEWAVSLNVIFFLNLFHLLDAVLLLDSGLINLHTNQLFASCRLCA